MAIYYIKLKVGFNLDSLRMSIPDIHIIQSGWHPTNKVEAMIEVMMDQTRLEEVIGGCCELIEPESRVIYIQ
jgi:hypothetical protein